MEDIVKYCKIDLFRRIFLIDGFNVFVNGGGDVLYFFWI